MRIIYSAVTDKGKKRKENQDRIFVSDSINAAIDINKNPCFAVFDGMGGEQRGGTASEIAKLVLEKKYKKTGFEDICLTANKMICLYMKKNNVFRMGTTAAMLGFDNSYAYFCNIGDSRIYKIANNEIEQLSVDHVMNTGRFRTRRVLTQYLGIPENEIVIEPYMRKKELRSGDTFLLCSDGLTDMVTDEIIKDIIIKSDIEDTANKLYEKAIANGGKDNISIIVCKIVD